MRRIVEGYKKRFAFCWILMELWYRDLLTAKKSAGGRIPHNKEIKRMPSFGRRRSLRQLLAKKAAAVRTARMRLAQNANFRLTMEVMLMDLKETGK